jgi:DNA-binding transcriptional LysR family regulator
MPHDVVALRYAVVTAQTESFARAALQEGVKQTTLSKRIAALEGRLGIQIFDRSVRGATLTDAGRAFIELAQKFLSDLDNLLNNGKALGSGRNGRLGLGFSASLASGHLRSIINAFLEKSPDTKIVGSEQNRDDLLRSVIHQDIDLAVVNTSQNFSGLNKQIVWSERVLVALPESHELAERDHLYWTDVRGQRFVLSKQDPGPDLGAMLAARLREPGCEPNIELQSISRENVLSMVSTGRYLSMTTENTMARMIPGVVLRAFCEPGGQGAHIDYACYWRGDNGNPVLKRFLSIVAERYSG